jgi:capsule biosynthesis phosphatase
MQKNQNIKSKKKVFLIDIDNTICKTFGSNYSKSVPKKNVIKLINMLKKRGHYIKIYTARYMNRHNQNSNIVKKKYYKRTLKQLILWNVKFDELILGKPSCDIMIDDKSLNPLQSNFEKKLNQIIKKI